MKYGNIHLLAILLSALYRHHPAFVVKVIDRVIESVCFGLEQNDFRFFQTRIAEVKYLGELYNYRMLEHPVIFDTLYRIVTFGYGRHILSLIKRVQCILTAACLQAVRLRPAGTIPLIHLMTSSEFDSLPQS